MFCGECGTKNEKNAKFCENCGSVMQPLDEEKVNITKENKHKHNKISKKTKLILIISGIILFCLIISFLILKSLTNPTKLAINYFEAVSELNVDKIYGYVEAEKSPFTSKEVFKRILNNTDNNKINVINSKIVEEKTSSDGLTMTVTISYITKDNKDAKNFVINLMKSKNKKWLIFDNWIIQNNNFGVVQNNELKVMKDSKVKIEDIELDKKYLDSSKSTKDIDVYNLPAMFQTNYKVTASLPIGIEIEKKILISKYNNIHVLEVGKNDLSEDFNNKVKESSKKYVESIYNGIISGKDFNGIKDSFVHEKIELNQVDTFYQKLFSTLTQETSKLISFNTTGFDTRNFKINENNELKFDLKMNYKYTISYQDIDNSVKTKEGTNYKYINLEFKIVDGNLYLINVSNLPDYFSKYL